jgi:Family of unknown function (DUF6544)
MTREPSLKQIWDSAPESRRVFDPARLSGLPEPARRYLAHAIAPGTPLASAVFLRMRGEIKLRRWMPFVATEVIQPGRGMLWRATARIHGIPISGFDRLIDGRGAMRWKAFGVLPVVDACGPDITRSAAGRMAAELLWLPSALCGEEVAWEATEGSCARAKLRIGGEIPEVSFRLDARGGVAEVRLARWGNPGGGDFRYEAFGAMVVAESRFSGYTIPVRLRVGWYAGTDRFAPEGEFFRVTVEEATYRAGSSEREG